MIDFKSTLIIALKSLKVNKMRSALTSLGIIIGIAAVIAMMAIGAGTTKKVQDNIESMGSNLLTIRSAAARTGGISMGIGSKPTLSVKDSEAIRNSVRGIEAVAPIMSSTRQTMYGNQNWSTSVYGVTTDYLYVKNYEIELGRGFTRDDDNNAAKIAIIGSTVVSELFGDVNPIDKTIRIGNIPFKVIGTLVSKGTQGPFDQDDLILIPLTTAQRKVFGTDFPGSVSQIIVKASSVEDSATAQSDIVQILRLRHSLGKTQENDFEIRNNAEFQEKMKSTIAMISTFIVIVAFISLIVGGIGVMNIMLVSVTERTKEIGIRMAIGARASDIRLQFLTEAVTLTLIGGLIGIAVGIVSALIFSAISKMPVVFTLFPIILSFGFSGLVGIGFGLYPAYKASLLNPIDALRYE